MKTLQEIEEKLAECLGAPVNDIPLRFEMQSELEQTQERLSKAKKDRKKLRSGKLNYKGKLSEWEYDKLLGTRIEWAELGIKKKKERQKKCFQLARYREARLGERFRKAVSKEIKDTVAEELKSFVAQNSEKIRINSPIKLSGNMFPSEALETYFIWADISVKALEDEYVNEPMTLDGKRSVRKVREKGKWYSKEDARILFIDWDRGIISKNPPKEKKKEEGFFYWLDTLSHALLTAIEIVTLAGLLKRAGIRIIRKIVPTLLKSGKGASRIVKSEALGTKTKQSTKKFTRKAEQTAIADKTQNLAKQSYLKSKSRGLSPGSRSTRSDPDGLPSHWRESPNAKKSYHGKARRRRKGQEDLEDINDPFTGEVLGQASASARTPRSLNTAIRADIQEAQDYSKLLDQGEIGLLRTNGANRIGVDSITYNSVDNMIYLNDSRIFWSTRKNVSKPLQTPKDWQKRTSEVINNLKEGPRLSKDEIRAIQKAWKEGRYSRRNLAPQKVNPPDLSSGGFKNL